MEGEIRPNLGERLVRRLERRTSRRPRIGLSPAFYERFGLLDPWIGEAHSDQSTDGDFVYLSSSPFYARLRRLAFFRKRREARLAALEKRYEDRQLGSTRRLWPTPKTNPFLSWDLRSLSIADLVLPELAYRNPEETIEELPPESPWGPRRDHVGARVSESPWFTTAHIPTKTFTTPRTNRPDALPGAVSSSAPESRQSVEQAAPSQQRLSRIPSATTAPRPLTRASLRSMRSTSAPSNAIQRLVEEIQVSVPSPTVRRKIIRIIRRLPSEQANDPIIIERILRSVGAVRGRTLNGPATQAGGINPSPRPLRYAENRSPIGHKVSSSGLKPALTNSPALRSVWNIPSGSSPGETAGEMPRTNASQRPPSSTRKTRPLHRIARRSTQPLAAGLSASPVAAAFKADPLSAYVATVSRSEQSTSSSAHAFQRLLDLPVHDQLRDTSGVGRFVSSHSPSSVPRAFRRFQPVRTAQGSFAPAYTLAEATVGSPEEHTDTDDNSVSPWFTRKEGESTAHTGPRTSPWMSHRPPQSPQQHAAMSEKFSNLRGTSSIQSKTVSALLPGTQHAANRYARVPSGLRSIATDPTADGSGSSFSTIASAPHGTQTRRPLRNAAVRMEMGAERTRSVLPITSPRSWSKERAYVRTASENLLSKAHTQAEAHTPSSNAAWQGRLPNTTQKTSARDPWQTVGPEAVLLEAQNESGSADVDNAEGAAPSPWFTGTASPTVIAQSRVAANVQQTPTRQTVIPRPILREIASQESLTQSVAADQSKPALSITGPSGIQQSMASKGIREKSESNRPTPMVIASSRNEQVRITGLPARLAAQASRIQKVVAEIAERASRGSLNPIAYARRISQVIPAQVLIEDQRGSDEAVDSEANNQVGQSAWGTTPASTSDATDRLSAKSVGPSSTPLDWVASRGPVSLQQFIPPHHPAAVAAHQAGFLAGQASHIQRSRPVPARSSSLGETAQPLVDWAQGQRGRRYIPSVQLRFLEDADAVNAGVPNPSSPAASPWLTPMRRPGDSTVQQVQGRYVAQSNHRGLPRAAETRGTARPLSGDAFALPEADTPITPGGGLEDADAGPSAWGRPRTNLPWTLGAVGAGATAPSMPNWAQRASGAPLIRGTGGDFVGALARASAPEEVVRVLFERSAGLTSTSSSLPKPIIQVIEQIKAEARQQDSQSTPTTNGWSPQETGTRRSQTSRVRGGAPRSTARVIRGFTPIKGGGLKKDVAGQDRIMKLAQKLQQLIHLSERNKELARQQVRMAEDSSAAMQEGQQEQGQGEQSDASQVDVDALSSEVLHFVNRELELRRERRLEDVDERNIWW